MSGRDLPGRLRIGVIGAGRLGAPLAAALGRAGHRIVGATAVSDASVSRLESMLPQVPRRDAQSLVGEADLVMLTVPDDAIATVASGLAALGAWQQGQLVVHCAGSRGLDELAAASAAGAIPMAIHPAMTFTGTSIDLDRMVGATFAVTAPAPFLPIAQALVMEIGGEPLVLDDAQRPLYHAALVHGANHAVTLVAQAAAMLSAAGVEEPQRVLAPLVHASIDGALSEVPGAVSTLTGPVVRGDSATVAAHLRALAHRPDALAAYRAMAVATAEAAHAGGRIGPAAYAELMLTLEAMT